MINLDRRIFCAGLGASLIAALPAHSGETLDRATHLLASAFRAENGDYGFAVFDTQGRIIWQDTLPARGHAIASNATGGKNVVFARRPGNFAVAFDPHKGDANTVFHSPLDRHFYGHGTFSGDGKLLFTTENDFEAGIGKIGVYDASSNFTRLGEFESYGIGPHDLMLMGDGKTLCAANGGIETHPDFGRTKLNIPSMEPSVAFIDTTDGSLKERHTLPAKLSKLSTRHMVLDATGQVWIGCQYEGGRRDTPPLILRIKQGDEITPLHLPTDVTARLSNYVGSIGINPITDSVMVTSPKGNFAVELDRQSGAVLSQIEKNTVCGVTSINGDWVLSTLGGMVNTQQTPVQWDNHLFPV